MEPKAIPVAIGQAPDGEEVDVTAEDPEDRRDVSAVVAALIHPVRSRIMAAFTEGEPRTVRQLATQLGDSTRRVRHHLDRLQALGLIEVAGEKRGSGVVELVYQRRHPAEILLGDRDLISQEAQAEASARMLELIISEVNAAVRAGTFLGRTGVELQSRHKVDPQGWEEFQALHERFLFELKALSAAVADRLAKEQAPPITAVCIELMFEAPDSDAKKLEKT
jgi:DNA-binding transcriptional ArsR family regulator